MVRREIVTLQMYYCSFALGLTCVYFTKVQFIRTCIANWKILQSRKHRIGKVKNTVFIVNISQWPKTIPRRNTSTFESRWKSNFFRSNWILWCNKCRWYHASIVVQMFFKISTPFTLNTVMIMLFFCQKFTCQWVDNIKSQDIMIYSDDQYGAGTNCVLNYALLSNISHEWTAVNMMTSSNGNIFRFTGHLWGEITGPRWIPHTKASDGELWCFLWSASE